MQDLFTFSWAFVVVVFLIIGLFLLLRYLQKKGVVPKSKSFTLKDSYYLDYKHRLIVLEWKNRDYLLLQTPQGVCVVDKRDAKE